MAEAGDTEDKKLNKTARGEIEDILEGKMGGGTSSLKPQVKRDVEEAVSKGEEAGGFLPPSPEEVKALYVRLDSSLDKLGIKKEPYSLEMEENREGDLVKGVGRVAVGLMEPNDPKQESELTVIIHHDEKNMGDLLDKQKIVLGNKGN